MTSSNFMEDDRFDGLYLNVAQQAQGIEPLLDTVFSFLRRKTDFFDGPNGDSSQALEKVQEVFQKHAALHLKNQTKKPTTSSSKPPKKPKKVTASAETTSSPPIRDKNQSQTIEMGVDGGFDISANDYNNSHGMDVTADQSTANATTTPQQPMSHANEEETKSPEAAVAPDEETSPQDDQQDNPEKSKKGPPPLGNGGTVPGKYVWTQTLSEVTVNIPVPQGTRGRDLKVVIGKNHLKVGLLRDPKKTMIIDAPLTKPIIMDDSFWTVEDGNRLVLQLQKLNGMEWWKTVCQGDAEIDVTTIQPESSKLDELDGETRKTVEKMMYDQRQKALGLPTSEQEEKMALLEKFKRQHPEMDFTHAKIN